MKPSLPKRLASGISARVEAAVRHAGKGPRRQSGQVLPMTAIMIVALLLAIWTMYDSGQLMTEKIGLQNTADNVAYSSSALVARDLNFSAYTTRAMVANQVAIGQMVGLSSWAKMMEQFGQNLGAFGKIANFVPYVGQVVYAITQAIEQATDYLATVVDNVAKMVIPVNNAVNQGLSVGQLSHHMAMSGALSNFTISVTAANDPDAEPLFGGVAAPAQSFVNWAKDIGRYDGGDASAYGDTTATRRVNEFAGVVNASRDQFSSARSYEMGFPLSGDIGLGDWETRKRGGSDFVATSDASGNYDWDWTAMDTVALEVSFKKPIVGCILCFDVPLGWGAAHALEGNGSYYDYEEGSGWGNAWDNDSAATLASYMQRTHNLGNTGGIRGFYAFRDEERTHNDGPAMILMFRKSAEAIPLTADLGATGDNPLNTGAGDGAITAAAKGQPYYARPTDLEQFARRDGNFEYGNLYNPFWQPRLAKLSDVEKSAVAAIAGAK